MHGHRQRVARVQIGDLIQTQDRFQRDQNLLFGGGAATGDALFHFARGVFEKLRAGANRLTEGDPARVPEFKGRVRVFSHEDLLDDDLVRFVLFEDHLQAVRQREEPFRKARLVREEDHPVIHVAKLVALDLDDAEAGLQRAGVNAHKDLSVLVFPKRSHARRHLNVDAKAGQFFWLELTCGIRHPESVSKISAETLQQYERTLQKDPNSKVFAALADAYREMSRWQEAEILARDGIARHPEYVGGFLVLARILILTRRAEDAEALLKKAVELSPENLLAYQLLGQTYVLLRRPAEALKAHKMVLFLNPMSEKSRQAVEKLETLSAMDYDDEVFEMRQLGKSEDVAQEPLAEKPKALEALVARSRERLRGGDLERRLSLVDALIVRNDLGRAREQLKELGESFPDSSEVQKRWAFFEEEAQVEEIETLRPVLSRERRMLDRKKRLLEALLQKVEELRARPLPRL